MYNKEFFSLLTFGFQVGEVRKSDFTGKNEYRRDKPTRFMIR